MENNVWKTTNDEFRGYTRAKLEEIHKDVAELCVRLTSHDMRIDTIEDTLEKKAAISKAMIGIAAAIGAVITFLGTVVAKIVDIIQ